MQLMYHSIQLIPSSLTIITSSDDQKWWTKTIAELLEESDEDLGKSIRKSGKKNLKRSLKIKSIKRTLKKISSERTLKNKSNGNKSKGPDDSSLDEEMLMQLGMCGMDADGNPVKILSANCCFTGTFKNDHYHHDKNAFYMFIEMLTFFQNELLVGIFGLYPVEIMGSCKRATTYFTGDRYLSGLGSLDKNICSLAPDM